MEELAAVLRHFLLPDNEKRQQAEKAFRDLSKDPGILPALAQFVASAPGPEERQLAAVLLRRKAGSLWAHQAPETQAGIKQMLLDRLAHEPSPLVRRACADVVSAVARQSVPQGQWPDLLPFLLRCCQSPQDEHRQVAFVLFGSLSETIYESLQPHLGELQPLFAAALRDPRPGGVRMAALRALEANVYGGALLDDKAFVPGLLLPLLDAGRLAAAQREEDAVRRACELLIEIAEAPGTALPGPPSPLLPAVVQFALDLTASTQLEPGTRYQAAQVLAWVCQGKARALGKHKLVQPIVAAMLGLLSEPYEGEDGGEEGGEGEGEGEAYELSAQRFAAQVLDSIAIHGPKKTVYSQVVAFSKGKMGHASHHVRFAAVMAIAVITEGCCEQVGERLEVDCLPLILRGFGDSHAKVKAGACFAVGQLSEYCEEAVVEHYKEVVTPVFHATDDPSQDVQTKAYYALAAFCQLLEEHQIVEFLDPLMHKLMGALRAALAQPQGQRGAHRAGTGLREMCLTAMGSAAVAAAEQFAPYCPAVLELLVGLVSLEGEGDLEVRARAYELVGVVGNAVGRPAVEGLIPGFMQAALQSFSLDHCELREYAHGLFADLAKLMEGDFAQVVPLALGSLQLNDGVIVNGPGHAGADGEAEALGLGLGGGGGEGGEGGEEEDDDEWGGEGAQFRVRTAVLDEKAAAAQALGAYARFVAPAFGPFLGDAMEALQGAAGYGHEDVRQQALESLQFLVLAADTVYPAPPSASGAVSLSAEASQALGGALTAYLEELRGGDDKATAAVAFRSAGELLDLLREHKCGKGPQAAQPPPDLILPYVQPLCELIHEALQGRLACQVFGEEEEEGEEGGQGRRGQAGAAGGAGGAGEDDVEEDEADVALTEAALDLVPPLARFLRAHFQPLLLGLAPHILELTRASRAPTQRSAAVGCIADTLEAAGSATALALEEALVPVLLRELASTETPNKRNAAFCAAMMCTASGGQAVQRHLPQLLRALHPLFGAEEEAAVRDNAASAIARILDALPGAVPLDQVLPVFVSALPVQEDMQEASVIYACIAKLLCAAHPQVLPMVPQIIPKLAQAVAETELEDEARGSIAHAVTFLAQAYPGELSVVLSSLPQEHAQALRPMLGE